MDYILNRIEQRIDRSPSVQELGVSVDLHQVWFLYIITLYLAILYNSNPEKVAEDRVEFLSRLERPALGTLIELAVSLGFGKDGRSFQKSLISRLNNFVVLRNARIGHGFFNTIDDVQETLNLLKYHKVQTQLDVVNGLRNGIESYLGNDCDIICVTRAGDGVYEGLCYKPNAESPIPWKSLIGESYEVGETYLSTTMNGECKVIRLSPFIHIDPESNSIYLYRSIKKRNVGKTIYYKILESENQEFSLTWNEFRFERQDGNWNSTTHISELPEHEIVVDANGRGNVTTLGEALSIAGDRTKIIIKPGNYHEHVVIERQVYICGEADEMGFPTIWGDVEGEAACIELKAAAHLKNLRITNGKCQKAHVGIVANADATIENVEIFKWNGKGIVSYESPYIKNCSLHDIDGDGILIEPWFTNPQITDCKFYNLDQSCIIANSTDGVVERCEFDHCSTMNLLGGSITLKPHSILSVKDCSFHNCGCDFFVGEESTVKVHNCVFENSIDMVDAYAKSKCVFMDCKFIGATNRGVDCKCGEGTFTNCEFSECLGDSAFRSEESKLSIEKCKFHGNKCRSVVLNKSSSGSLLNCDFYKNEDASICVQRNSSPYIENCRVHDVQSFGIVFFESTGKLNNCELYNCSYPALRIGEKSNPIVERCLIQNNGSIGLWIAKESLGQINHCEFSGNRGISIQVDSGSNPVIKNCKIHDVPTNGMYFSESEGLVENCDMYFCSAPSLVIANKANPKVCNSGFHDNLNSGLYVFKDGKGLIEGCQFYRNKYTMVCVESGAEPYLKDCEFCDSEYYGIGFTNCQGTVECCKFHDVPSGAALLEGGNPSFLRSEFFKIKGYAVAFKKNSLGYLEDCTFHYNQEHGLDFDDDSDPVILNCHGICADEEDYVVYKTVMVGKTEWMLENSSTRNMLLSWWQANKFAPAGWILPSEWNIRYVEKYLAEHPLRSNSSCLTMDRLLNFQGEFWTSNEKKLLYAGKMNIGAGNAESQFQFSLKTKKLPVRLLRL